MAHLNDFFKRSDVLLTPWTNASTGLIARRVRELLGSNPIGILSHGPCLEFSIRGREKVVVLCMTKPSYVGLFRTKPAEFDVVVKEMGSVRKLRKTSKTLDLEELLK